jgi:outer membrane murein-binding lipoprotein Lpp
MQALFLACIPISSALMAGCLSDVKILDATSRGVVLTGSNEARV